MVRPRGTRSQVETMRWVLFWVFVCIFVAVALLTILALFFDIGKIKPQYESWFIRAFFIAVAAAIVALFYSLFNITLPRHGFNIIRPRHGRASSGHVPSSGVRVRYPVDVV